MFDKKPPEPKPQLQPGGKEDSDEPRLDPEIFAKAEFSPAFVQANHVLLHGQRHFNSPANLFPGFHVIGCAKQCHDAVTGKFVE